MQTVKILKLKLEEQISFWILKLVQILTQILITETLRGF